MGGRMRIAFAFGFLLITAQLMGMDPVQHDSSSCPCCCNSDEHDTKLALRYVQQVQENKDLERENGALKKRVLILEGLLAGQLCRVEKK